MPRTDSVDLVGRRYGLLLVLQEAQAAVKFTAGRKRRLRVFKCACDCGNHAFVKYDPLRRGKTRSCGCHALAVRSKNAKYAHEGRRTHGKCGTPTYTSWLCAKQRCYNPKTTGYKYYGGRGIAMCVGWRNSFEAFLFDMGERPSGTSIERRDNSGNYTPDNCYWATPGQQAANKRKRGTC